MKEEKIKKNLHIFKSVKEEFENVVNRGIRGDLGTGVSAALLMFVTAPPQERQRYIDIIKLAEGRGLEGSILDAARRLIEKENQFEGASVDELPPRGGEGAKKQRQQQESGSRRKREAGKSKP